MIPLQCRATAGVGTFVRDDARLRIRVELDLRIDPCHADRLSARSCVAGLGRTQLPVGARACHGEHPYMPRTVEGVSPGRGRPDGDG